MKTTLKPDPRFELTKQERGKGFFYLFSNSKKLNPTLFARLWLNTIYPTYATHPKLGSYQVGLRAYNSMNNISTKGLTVERRGKGFAVKIPVASANGKSGLSPLAFTLSVSKRSQLNDIGKAESYFDVLGPKGINDHSDMIGGEVVKKIIPLPPPKEAFGELPLVKLQEVTLEGIQALKGLELPVAVKKALSSCLINVSTNGNDAYITFFITDREACYLVNKPIQQVRLLDIFNFAANWIDFSLGATGHIPADVTFSVTQVADVILNNPAYKKTNSNGLSVNIQGDLIYLPETNNAAAFESGMLRECTVNDTLVGKNTFPTLSNKLVLLDWDNAKLAYTNSVGRLRVLDLQYNRAPNAAQVLNLAEREVDNLFITFLQNVMDKFDYKLPSLNLEDMSFSSGDTHVSLDASSRSFSNTKTIKGLVEGMHIIVNNFYLRSLNFVDISRESDFPLGKYLADVIDDLYKKVKPVISEALPNNSILHTLESFASMVLVSEYLGNMAKYKKEANECTLAAKNQSEDTDFVAEPLPFIREGIGRLPHQYKIANLSKERPLNMLFPVQAGGGKSLLTILDVLTEIKNGSSKKFVVMCPGHLVSQYTKEIAYFTKNQINAIPINTEIYNRQGVERIFQMITNAPINSIVFVDLDFVKYQNYNINYGSTNFIVYPIAEFLKGFRFDYVLVDESHYLKNLDTSRSASVLGVLVDIIKKRLASATMAFDSPSDLASQVSILDPTLFGSKERFNLTYAMPGKVSGGRVMEWRPEAQGLILEKIKSSIVYASAMRREWAALLPPSQEVFIRTELTPNQKVVYKALLDMTLEEVKNNASLMSRIKSFEDDGGDPDSGADLADLLRPFLARLEQFITAPGADALGKLHLKGKDLISPKVLKIDERIRQHLSSNTKGKILIFTNYVESAKAIYEGLSPEIKERTLLYKASEKAAMLSRFKNNPNIDVMVGVENSMNTGLDIQFVSRLIRVETVWNPGTLEQGTSRINRPEVKAGETRDSIYFDWVVCDETIDITKLSRLISKIVTVARFENSEVMAYRSVPEVPVIKMSLDNIFALNDWDSSLMEYAHAYKKLREVEQEDYAEFKKLFIAKYGNNFFFPIKQDKKFSKGALASHLPYARGTDLYGADDLGLTRLDVLLDNADGHIINIENLPVHTDWGDGRVVRHNVASSSVRVKLRSDSKTFHTTNVFAKSRSIKGPTRKALLKGFSNTLPIIQTVSADFKMPKVKAKEFSKQVRLAVVESNGYVGMKVVGDVTNNVLSVLQNLGFVSTNSFLRVNVPKPSLILKALSDLDAFGLTPALGTKGDIDKLVKLSKSKLKVKNAKELGLENVHTMQFKGRGKSTHPYINITSGTSSIVVENRLEQQVLLSKSKVPWKLVPASLGWFTKDKKLFKKQLKALRKSEDLDIDKKLLKRTLQTI